MAKEQPKFLAVLPWLQLAEEIEVGPFTFWRWPEDAEKYVPRQADRDGIIQSVNKAFAEMKQSREDETWNPAPLSSFCVISGKDGECLFDENEFRLLRKPVNALNACALFATHNQFYKNSTDFALYQVPSKSDSRYWRTTIRRRHGTELRMGNPEPFLKPAECTSKALNKNLPLLASLGELLESPNDNLSSRIFRALDLFTSAFTDSRAIHPYAEIVLLVTAFEILLNIYNVYSEKKKEKLGKRISRLFTSNTELLESTRNKSWKVFWIESFYELRNNIVHGKEIPFSNLRWVHNPYAGLHTAVALKVFRLALMKTLAEKGFHTETEEDHYQSDRLDEFLSSDSYKSFPQEHDKHWMKWCFEKLGHEA